MVIVRCKDTLLSTLLLLFYCCTILLFPVIYYYFNSYKKDKVLAPRAEPSDPVSYSNLLKILSWYNNRNQLGYEMRPPLISHFLESNYY